MSLVTDLPVPPSPLELLREGLLPLELPRFLLNLPWLATRARGLKEPVYVIPGFGATDLSTTVLRSYLEYLGYTVEGWGLGRNHGRVEKLLPRIAEKVETLRQRTGSKVRLIGWSLGGYLAREVARERPEIVDRVITLGAPVVGGPKYTQSGRWYQKNGYDLDEIERTVEARWKRPIEVPVTAIYSRVDGVVTWQACVDRIEKETTHFEVLTTHLGLVLSAEVLLLLAGQLRD